MNKNFANRPSSKGEIRKTCCGRNDIKRPFIKLIGKNEYDVTALVQQLRLSAVSPPSEYNSYYFNDGTCIHLTKGRVMLFRPETRAASF